jgi:hypothetical protein
MLDFLFGRTKAVPTTTTTVQTSKLPEEIAPYVTQVLEEAQKQYEFARDEGYQPYPGETIAPMTQEEKDAIAGLRGLVGGQAQYIQEAETALDAIPTEFTAESAQKFMSPYQQAVTDIEKRKAQEDFQRRIMPEFEKQAVGAGGMSGLGSRAGVQAASLGEAQLQQLGDIQARGQQKAYEDAYRQFTDQGARQRARAADLQNLGLTKFQTGLAEQGLAQQLAQADRAEAQAEFDESFREYIEQEQYPESELAQLSSFVYGNPFLRQADTTKSVQGMLQPTTSMGQGLLNLGLTGLNIYGRGLGSDNQFSMANFGRSFQPRKTGGRIVHRQEGGEVPNVYNQGQQTTASPMMGSRGGLGSLFGFRFPRRQTNVIENIDNAAGSLNDYKETMDENMQNLRIATQAIGSSYNNTFGDRINLLRRIAGPQQATPTVAEMKAGGGLGSLPVIKRRASGQTGIGPYGLDYMGRVQGPNIRYTTPNDPTVNDLTTNRLLQAIRQPTLPGTLRRSAPRLRTGLEKKADLLSNIASQKDMYKTQAQKRADKIKKIRERRSELTEEQKSALLKQLEGRNTLSGPIREAQKELLKPGVETLGFLNQASIAANTLMAEQDKQRANLAKEKADITMKTLELQQEANKLEDAEKIAALTKEENVEEKLLKKELTADDVAEAQDLLQYTTDFDDIAKKVGLVTKISEIDLNQAKLVKELNKKDTQVVAAFNAIRKDVREAMGVFMETLPSGKKVIRINGKPFTKDAAAPVNEAVRKAFEAYVNAGGGSKGMKKALQVTPAYTIPPA